MFFDEIYDEKYNETYDQVHFSLMQDKDHKESYTINDLENFINSLYVQQGNNWLGMSAYKEAAIAATIAAAEAVYDLWQQELAATNLSKA